MSHYGAWFNFPCTEGKAQRWSLSKSALNNSWIVFYHKSKFNILFIELSKKKSRYARLFCHIFYNQAAKWVKECYTFFPNPKAMQIFDLIKALQRAF